MPQESADLPGNGECGLLVESCCDGSRRVGSGGGSELSSEALHTSATEATTGEEREEVSAALGRSDLSFCLFGGSGGKDEGSYAGALMVKFRAELEVLELAAVLLDMAETDDRPDTADDVDSLDPLRGRLYSDGLRGGSDGESDCFRGGRAGADCSEGRLAGKGGDAWGGRDAGRDGSGGVFSPDRTDTTAAPFIVGGAEGRLPTSLKVPAV